jgi:phosphatidylinositol-3,4,5-trisphosphate 3-phosphatase/dual-specificity protein phosphatase PTEN
MQLIAMGFPSVGHEGLFRNHSDEVYRFFETMHSDKYKVYNLCRYLKKRKKEKEKKQ